LKKIGFFKQEQYSMKLLTERYLGGKVDFESTEEEGTDFKAVIPVVKND